MKKIAKQYWNDVFWRNNAIFLAGSLFVAFLNYLYYPVLGRLMDVSNFGEIQALLSIFNLIGMALVAFQIVVINISANNQKASVTIIRQFERLALAFMASIGLLFVLLSTKLQEFFNFSSYLPFMVLGLVLIVSVPVTFRQAYIQGKKNFAAVSIGGSIGALGKLLFSAILVLAGFKTLGAMAGILMAHVLILIYASYIARRMGFVSAAHKLAWPDLGLLKPELRYLLSVMTVFFIVTLLYTGDVLVVKRYFSPEEAGLYAGISAIAKIIFFATASFAGVLLASVGQAYSKEDNKAISRKSLLLVASVGGAALLIFSLFPKLVITLMLGERYAAYAHLLPLLSLVIFLMAIVNLCFYYFLALRQYVIVPIAIAGGAMTLSLTVLRHATLEAVIHNFLIGSLLVLGLIGGLSILQRLRFKSKKTL